MLNKLVISITIGFIVAFWALIIRELLLLPLPDIEILGFGSLAVGLGLAILSKNIASKFYSKIESSKSKTFFLWFDPGENNTRLFYLLAGFITAAAGCLIIFLGWNSNLSGS